MKRMRINTPDRHRLWIIPMLFACFVGAWVLNAHFTDIISYITGIPQEEIAFKGVEYTQSLNFGLYKLTFGMFVCGTLAWVTQPMIDENKMRGWSRFAFLYALYLFSFSQLAVR